VTRGEPATISPNTGIPVAAFIAWQRREQILALDYQPAWWGLGVMAWAALQGYVGTLGAELFLQRTSFLIALLGLLLVLGGTRLVRELAFPLLLLLFMIPIPSVIYNQITFPLQLLAYHAAMARGCNVDKPRNLAKSVTVE
jgi:exosortase